VARDLTRWTQWRENRRWRRRWGRVRVRVCGLCCSSAN
jgi:hypothetical protein